MANESISSLLTRPLEVTDVIDLFNIINVRIEFDGTLDAYLAKTDTMPNPSQHVLYLLIWLHSIEISHYYPVRWQESITHCCIYFTWMLYVAF